jgi:hypothetical protein
MAEQIGRMNILAVSGGRLTPIDEHTLDLPVNQGYRVRVIYNPVPDLYTVQRILRRGAKEWIKGELTNVYCDELGEAVYGASCYVSYPVVRNNCWADQ